MSSHQNTVRFSNQLDQVFDQVPSPCEEEEEDQVNNDPAHHIDNIVIEENDNPRFSNQSLQLSLSSVLSPITPLTNSTQTNASGSCMTPPLLEQNSFTTTRILNDEMRGSRENGLLINNNEEANVVVEEYVNSSSLSSSVRASSPFVVSSIVPQQQETPNNATFSRDATNGGNSAATIVNNGQALMTVDSRDQPPLYSSNILTNDPPTVQQYTTNTTVSAIHTNAYSTMDGQSVDANNNQNVLPPIAQSEQIVVATIRQDENDVINVAYSTSQPQVQFAASLYKGFLPSNKTIDNTIQNTRMTLSNISNQLDDHGKLLAGDIEALLTSVQHLIHSKNQKEQIQKIFHEAVMYQRQSNIEIGTLEEHDERATVTDKRDVFANVKQVIVFMVKNSSFREFIMNYISIVRSILVGRMDEKNAERLYRTVEVGYKYGDKDAVGGKVIDPNIPNPALDEASFILSLEQRLQRLLLHLSKNPEYNQSMFNIMSIVDFIFVRISQIEYREMHQHNQHFEKMTNEIYDLIGRYCGIEKVYLFRDSFWSLFQLVEHDTECLQYFQDLRGFTIFCIEHSGEVSDAYLQTQTTKFVRRGHILFDTSRQRYRAAINQMLTTGEEILRSIIWDSDQRDCMQQMNKLFKDFVCDDIGRPDVFIMQNSIEQSKLLLLPVIQQVLDTVPLPSIEGENKEWSYSVSNVVLSGSDMLPDHLHTAFKNNVNFRPIENDPSSSNYQFSLCLDNIRMGFYGITFLVKHKKFPRFQEYGTVDVTLGGRGMSMILEWTFLKFENLASKVELNHVKCSINKLALDIKQARYKHLANFFSKIFSKLIRKKIEEAIQENVASGIAKLNNQLNDFLENQHATQRVKTQLNGALKRTYEVVQQFDMDRVRSELVHSPGETPQIIQEHI